ncbi:unnamed protein product [Sphagnum troendelagicum]|uniref:Protein kinase domain-containing protein n=1 Tax=Sphagnum troendelagicum TaxID=128251 RepID=A0ABP0U4P0_9BRYO
MKSAVIVLLLWIVQIHGTKGLLTDGLTLLVFKNGFDCQENDLEGCNDFDASLCSWEGVLSSDSEGLVSSLVLFHVGLVGSVSPSPGKLQGLEHLRNLFKQEFLFGDIPSELGNCSNLMILALDNNMLTGSIPIALGKLPVGLASCTNITTLALGKNMLDGNIPAAIRKLRALQNLDLSKSELNGEIPAELGSCTNLKVPDIQSKQLTAPLCSGSDGLVSSLLLFNAGLYGSISPSLGKLQALKYLNLSANSLTGEIPVELASCTMLTTLALGNNMLDGSIPAAIGKLQALQNLDLSTNKLAGEIPGELASCTKLTTLALGNNMLNGSIPAAIGKLQALQNLDLSTNKLAGEIPGELASCTKLTTLALGNNMLDGSIPAAIGKLQALQNLDLSTNKLTGEIPGELDSCTNLKVLKIQFNQLTGSIPPGIYNISNLMDLDIHGNNFIGTIPPELASISSLETLDLSSNKLTGLIPPELGNLINLVYLNLAQNRLTGPLPAELGQLKNLTKILVYNNKLNGTIPSSLTTLENLFTFDVHNNYISGSIPAEFFDSGRLMYLDMSSNAFSGQIPHEIGNDTHLVVLNLSWNKFSGTIPTTLGSLQALQVLDLSHNQLSGTILPSLGTQLISLKSINVSYNHLNGSLPCSWVRFLVANYDSFIGNPGLCLKYSSHNQCIKNIDVNIRIMIIVISCVVFIVGLSIFACCYIRRRSKSTLVVPNDMEILSVLGREISFNNIMEATQNLSDDYIIGKGGQGIVYKAVLHNGNVVAVKKIPLLNKDIKIHKSFLREINTIGKVKHRNLVKLLGFCKFGKIALVVYNYFPKGDLFDAIHNKERGIVLDWDTRLKIVEGIAHGLAYLHHYCVPPIIHRDIKSRNVLLDVDMEAHITDFGIAKAIALKPNEDYVNTTITIEGTYGYIAPENGYETQVTPKVDVYSFGVLLLELLTGKQPLDPSFGEFEHIVPWVLATMKQNGPNLNDDVFDSTLLDTATDVQKEQMFQVLKIAIVCTKDIPSKRLTMTHVLEILGMSRVNACSPLCN